MFKRKSIAGLLAVGVIVVVTSSLLMKPARAETLLEVETDLANREIDLVLERPAPRSLHLSLLNVAVRAQAVVNRAMQDPLLRADRTRITQLQLEVMKAQATYLQLELRKRYDDLHLDAAVFDRAASPCSTQQCQRRLRDLERARADLARTSGYQFYDSLQVLAPQAIEIWNRHDLTAWRTWIGTQSVGVAYWLGRLVLDHADVNRNDSDVYANWPLVKALFESVREREPAYDHFGGLGYFGLSGLILSNVSVPASTAASRDANTRVTANDAIEEAIRRASADARGYALNLAYMRFLRRDLYFADLSVNGTRERLVQTIGQVINLDYAGIRGPGQRFNTIIEEWCFDLMRKLEGE